MTATIDPTSVPQTAKHGLLSRLYTGTGAFEVIGNRKKFYVIGAGILLICFASIVLRGFSFGIEFEGGSKISMPALKGVETSQVADAFAEAAGEPAVSVQRAGSGAAETFQIRSAALSQPQVNEISKALFDAFEAKDTADQLSLAEITSSDVSETWGGQITRKALIALAVFLVLVTAYIAIRYERDMALAALAALVFDMVCTAGIYSIVGFEFTPATVIGLLAILGFSLYDSVVVFDKVEENTRGTLHLNKRTFGEQANLAINQTLMRSINTTIIGILPVIGLMVIAVWALGVGTLKDLALVQLVGMMVGAYSSIFVATPIVVTLKERFGPYAAHTKKVLAKRSGAIEKAAKAATLSEAAAKPAASTATAPKPAAPAPGARPSGKRARRR